MGVPDRSGNGGRSRGVERHWEYTYTQCTLEVFRLRPPQAISKKERGSHMLGNYDENRIIVFTCDESIKCADSQSKHCVMFPKTMPKGAVQDLLMTFPSLTLGEGMSAEHKIKTISTGWEPDT